MASAMSFLLLSLFISSSFPYTLIDTLSQASQINMHHREAKLCHPLISASPTMLMINNAWLKQERRGQCGIGKAGTDFGEATMFQVVQIILHTMIINNNTVHNQGCRSCCSLAVGLRGNGERMRK